MGIQRHRVVGRRPRGFPLSKSNSFHQVFIKLCEYVGGHYISTKFYNLPKPTGTPELWPLNYPKSELAVSALQVELFHWIVTQL